MNTEEFRVHGKQMIDYICDYVDNVHKKDVVAKVLPGFLKEQLPDEAPQKPESFLDIMQDVDDKIMPGMVHWNHPQFFAYFPSGNSFPSILAEMLSSATGAIGFSWASCPSLTELERIVCDWFARALDLPDFFLSENSNPESSGGGVLQGSASDCALACIMAARARTINKLRGNNREVHESVYLPQLVAYSSREAHSSIEKAAKMAFVQLRVLEPDNHDSLRGDTLKQAIEKDLAKGLTPFFVVATVGTTGSCAFDNLTEIGQVCKEYPSIWFHVDGAYAGNSFILPEMRKYKEGMEYADSFNTNPNKLLLVNFDCSAMWVKDVLVLTSALAVDPLYLQHEHDTTLAIDYRHYGIPLSRRFRSLKLWFVFRTYGIVGLQKYIRNHIKLAKHFEQLVKSDDRFEVKNDVILGLVCFRIKHPDRINRELLARINHSGKFHMVPAMVKGRFIIRFCVTYEHATIEHIDGAWKAIQEFTDEVLAIEYPTEYPEVIKPTVTKKNSNKLSRQDSIRFSFTRQVSPELYQRQTSKQRLVDMCTSIAVADTDDILSSLQQASQNNLQQLNEDSDTSNQSI